MLNMRVWLKEQRKMLEVLAFNKRKQTVLTEEGTFNLDNNVVLMQSLGVKSLEGEDLFYEDVVYCDNQIPFVATIEKDECSVPYLQDVEDWGERYEFAHFYDNGAMLFTKIGNIYQDTEKVKKRLADMYCD